MKTLVLLPCLVMLVLQLFSLSCYDIQYTTDPDGASPYAGEEVTVEAIVVAERFYTGSNSNNYGFMLGDVNGGPWSGLFVFDALHSPERGDLVQVTGSVQEYYNSTEMVSLSSFTVLSQGNPLPPATELSTGQLVAQGEPWENVLVSVHSVSVTALANTWGEFYVNDGSGNAQINDQCFPRNQNNWPSLSLGQSYDRISGVVYESYSIYGINPRDSLDIDQYSGSSSEDPSSVPGLSLVSYPNPGHGSVVFKADAAVGEIDIYNLKGRKLVSLELAEHQAIWDARDEQGKRLPAGIYLTRFRSGRQVLTGRIILLGD